MPLLSRKGILAIAAVIDVALNSDLRPVSAKALAARHGLPPRHLEPVLQALVHEGILRGVRGPRGGYELGRGQDEITANEILRAAGTVDDGPGTQLHGSPLVVTVVMPALADATALRQVIHNLLTNAAKYAGADGPIVVRLSEEGGWLRLEVIDQGPGLGSQPHDLFQLFHRSPNAARMAPGSGIGLYVAQQLVRAMGGTIEAGTRDEGGARFEVRLPTSIDDDDDA